MTKCKHYKERIPWKEGSKKTICMFGQSCCPEGTDNRCNIIPRKKPRMVKVNQELALTKRALEMACKWYTKSRRGVSSCQVCPRYYSRCIQPVQDCAKAITTHFYKQAGRRK